MKLSQNLKLAINASLLAGKKIIEVYNSDDFNLDYKEDNSPLTLADMSSNKIIGNILSTSNIPILSEEGNIIDYQKRKDLKNIWIVDPLDGTKEFIKKNGEFTVNISLIENKKPILGVIYAPALNLLYFSQYKMGSYKLDLNDFILNDIDFNKALRLPITKSENKYLVVTSRSHLNKQTLNYIKNLKNFKSDVDTINLGSSLKFCFLAEGKVDCYPRFSPCMEWDTAAGHIICKEAGFEVIDQMTKKEIIYNREDLLNNSFIVK